MKKIRPDWNVDSGGVDPATQTSEDAKKYLARESAEQYLKKVPEGLDGKQLSGYDLIVAMKPEHREIILNSCQECEDKIVVWNIDDPYFLPHGYAEKIFEQVREKVKELAGSF